MSVEKQTEKELNEMSEPTGVPTDEKREQFIDPDTGAKEKFNSDVHATDKNGNPILRKDGFFRRKPGASKKPSGTGEKSSTMGIDPGTGMTTPTSEMSVVATAKTICHLQFMGGIALWGEMGKPAPDEEQYLLYAWATYLAEKGVDNIPPVIVVLMATGMYAMPRFINHPGSRKKVKSVWDKIFKKKDNKTDAPQPDSRNDGKRKDNPGGKKVGNIPK